MKTLPNPGTYVARRNAMMVIEPKESGSLLLWVPYVLMNCEVNYSGKHMVVLGEKDGNLSQKKVATLKKVFPSWDGVDPFGLEEVPLPEDPNAPEFELADCYHDDTYTPPGAAEPLIQLKAQWLNALGGTQNMPAALDEEGRKAVRTKWLGKFKAANGPAPKSSPAQSAAPKPAAAVPPKAGTTSTSKSAGPPGRKPGNATTATPRTATGEEVWDLLSKNGAGDEANGPKFYGAQDELFPGRDFDANPLNPAEWGQVADKIGV